MKKYFLKKHFKSIIPIFCVVITALFMLILSNFAAEIKVTSNLNKMLSDKDMAIYSHTIVYAQKHSKEYHEILDLGEKAIRGLMKDFVAHPNNLRRQLIIDLVDDIAGQEELVSDETAQAWYASDSEWFEAVGKNLYEKYVGKVNLRVMKSIQNNETEQQKVTVPQKTILRGKEFEFEEGTNIPEPEDTVSPGDGIKWDTRLGCYILDNIYYDEVNKFYYMID